MTKYQMESNETRQPQARPSQQRQKRNDGQQHKDRSTSHTSSYALVPLTSTPSGAATSSSSVESASLTDMSPLPRIYECYASKFPNPSVVRQSRYEAMTMAKDEDERERVHDGNGSAAAADGDSGGIWNRFFGSSRSNKKQRQDDGKGRGSEELQSLADGEEKDGDNGECSNKLDNYDDDDDDTIPPPLLGTDKVDWSVVPPEAHHAARFHLASNAAANADDDATGQRRNVVPSICRTGTAAATCVSPSHDSSTSFKSILTVVDWGTILEYPATTASNQTNHSIDSQQTKSQKQQQQQQQQQDQHLPTPILMETNDKEALLYQYNGNETSPLRPSLSYVRSVQLSQNCIAVSWGLDDGIIVIYRRVHCPDKQITKWDGVAILTPTEEVIDAASRTLTEPTPNEDHHDNHDNQSSSWWWNNKHSDNSQLTPFESGLLRVSDMTPLRAPTNNSNDSNNPPTLLLAVARLGGFLELLLIPPQLRDGPVLVHNPRRRNRPQRQHYAAGLPDLASENYTPLAAVSTVAYHTDITAIAAVRTDVRDGMEWDDVAFPEAPPAEFLLALVGSSSGGVVDESRCVYRSRLDFTRGAASAGRKVDGIHADGDVDADAGGTAGNCGVGECVSLWAVAIIDDGVPGGNKDENVTIHAAFLDKIDLCTLGPEVSTFLTDLTIEKWVVNEKVLPSLNQIDRRRISGSDEVADSMTLNVETIETNDDVTCAATSTKKRVRSNTHIKRPIICTVTTTPPITALQFSPYPSQGFKGKLLLSALDYNGGVTILDCTGIANVATHQIHSVSGDINSNSTSNNDFTDKNFSHDGDNTQVAYDNNGLDIIYHREEMMISPKRFHMDKEFNMGRNEPIVSVGWWTSSDHGLLLATATRGGFICIKKVMGGSHNNNVNTGGYLKLGSGLQNLFCVSTASSNTKRSGRRAACAGALVQFIPDVAAEAVVLPFLHSSRSTRSKRVSTVTVANLCALQSLNPQYLFRSFVQQCKYQEALEVASQFDMQDNGDGVRELMNVCFKNIWEKDCDSEALKRVFDDEYVIDAAMSLETTTKKDSRLDLDVVQVVLAEALHRAKAMLDDRRKSEDVNLHFDDEYGISRENDHNLEEIVETFRSKLTLLRTFSILGELKGARSKPSVKRLFKRFLHVDTIKDLAISFASSGDLDSLSLMFVRHWNVIGSNVDRMEILSHLSFGVEFESYGHLLPCWSGIGESGPSWCSLRKDGKDKKTLSAEEGNVFMNVLQLANYVRNHFNLTLYTDELDEENVLDAPFVVDFPASLYDLAQWYLHRAEIIHSSTGLIGPVIELCTAAMIRCHHDAFELNNPIDSKSEHVISRIFSLRISARTVDFLLSNGILSDIYMTIPQFEALGFEKIVGIILEGSRDAEDAILRCKKYLCPMLDGSDHDNFLGNAINRSDFEHSVVSFCLCKLINARKEDSNGVDRSYKNMENALFFGVAFAQASSTCLPRNQRIVQDEKSMIRFVLSVANEIDSCISRSVVGMLWTLYECLPENVKDPRSQDEESNALSHELDNLYLNIIVLDLISRWSAEFDDEDVNLKQLQQMRNTFLSRSEKFSGLPQPVPSSFEAVGSKVLSIMSKGFCDKVWRYPEIEARKILLQFLADTMDLNIECFGSQIPVNDIIDRYVIHVLLQQHSFNVIRDFLLTAPDWLDMSFLRCNILEFVRSALTSSERLSLFSSDNSTVGKSNVQIAMECQDILGPLLPESKAEFEASRRFLDAAHFMQHVLECDSSYVPNLVTFKSTSPMKMVELVLKNNPYAIIMEWPDWAVPDVAAKANFDILRYLTKMSESVLHEENNNLPPPPGGPILHFAGLLGLHDPRDQFIVKNLMVLYAMEADFHGAALAVCNLLLRDASSVDDSKDEVINNDARVFLLSSLSSVISCELFTDYWGRKELCVNSLKWCKTNNLTKDELRLYGNILSSYQKLENLVRPNSDISGSTKPVSSIKNNTSHDKNARFPDKSDFIVFRAAGLISKQAKNITRHNLREFDQFLGHENTMSFHLNTALKLKSVDSSTNIQQIIASMRHGIFLSIENPKDVNDVGSSKDADYNFVSRQLIKWCIGETANIHNDTRSSYSATDSSPYTFDQIKDVLHFGIALLLEEKDVTSSSSFIQTTLDSLKSRFADNLEHQSNVEAPKFIVPNEDIVRQLCERGYSLNGARRSAIMSNNESFRAAMIYAVANFQERNFDDPILILKDKHEKPKATMQFVDERLAKMINDALTVTQKRINGLLRCSSPCISIKYATENSASSLVKIAGVEARKDKLPSLDESLNNVTDKVEKPIKEETQINTCDKLLGKCPSKATLFAEKDGSVEYSPLPLNIQPNVSEIEVGQPLKKTELRHGLDTDITDEATKSILTDNLQLQCQSKTKSLIERKPEIIRKNISTKNILPVESEERVYVSVEDETQEKNILKSRYYKEEPISKKSIQSKRYALRYDTPARALPSSDKADSVCLQTKDDSIISSELQVQIVGFNPSKSTILSPTDSISVAESVSSRISFREIGEQVREESKEKVRHLTIIERQKLAEEGKRILEGARKSRGIASNTASSNVGHRQKINKIPPPPPPRSAFLQPSRIAPGNTGSDKISPNGWDFESGRSLNHKNIQKSDSFLRTLSLTQDSQPHAFQVVKPQTERFFAGSSKPPSSPRIPVPSPAGKVLRSGKVIPPPPSDQCINVNRSSLPKHSNIDTRIENPGFDYSSCHAKVAGFPEVCNNKQELNVNDELESRHDEKQYETIYDKSLLLSLENVKSNTTYPNSLDQDSVSLGSARGGWEFGDEDGEESSGGWESKEINGSNSKLGMSEKKQAENVSKNENQMKSINTTPQVVLNDVEGAEGWDFDF